MKRLVLVLGIGGLLLTASVRAQTPAASAQAPLAQIAKPAEAILTVTGGVEKPLFLSIGDLQQLPRKTVKVYNPRESKEETYEGVLLDELLTRAGSSKARNFAGQRWLHTSWLREPTGIAWFFRWLRRIQTFRILRFSSPIK